MSSIASHRPVYSRSRYKAAAALFAILMASGSYAGDVVRNNTAAGSLNSGSLWVGGVAPTSADVALYNNTTTTAVSNVLGGNLTWSGIRVANPGGNVTIATGSTLTLGSSGIDLSAATVSLIINANLTIGSSQSWSVATGRSIQLGNNANFSENGSTLSVSGAGTLDWRSNFAGTVSGPITLGTISVNSPSANLTATSSSSNYTVLNVVSGKFRASSIANFGTTSAAGTGGTNTAITLGGTSSSGVLEYTGGTTSSNRTFNMDRRSNGNSILVSDQNAILTVSGNIQTSAGNATSEKDVALTAGGAGSLILNGVISNHSGAFKTSIIKSDSGTVTLGGSNTFLGGVTINQGTLVANQANALGNSTNTANIKFAGGTLKYGSGISTDYSSRIKSSSGAIAVDTNGQNINFANALDSSNTAGLSKVGSGNLTLAAANTYTGTTTISAGTLTLGASGSIDASSAILANATLDVSAKSGFTIGATQTLAGTGSVTGAVAFSGTLTPGASGTGNIGTFTIDGAVTGNSGASFNFDIGGAGNTYDILKLGSLNASSITLNLTNKAQYTWIEGDVLQLFQTTGGGITSVAGSFANNGLLSSSLPTLSSGLTWDLTGLYSLGQINVVSAIPEPSAFAILAGLAGLGLAGLRRRRS